MEIEVSPNLVVSSWKVIRFGLLVTGKGERKFIDRFFRSLCEEFASAGLGVCTFEVIAKIGQLTPRTTVRPQKIKNAKGRLPTRDEEAGTYAWGFLKRGGDFVILLDDLERDRRNIVSAVFIRYREAFDRVLPNTFNNRASVHFLVNMLEAYYFADAHAINSVKGTSWTDYDGDVETIDHPKNELKQQLNAFDEIQDGEKIVQILNVPHVLSNPATCASLRTLFAWCWRALRIPLSPHAYQLANGRYSDVTGGQIEMLPAIS